MRGNVFLNPSVKSLPQGKSHEHISLLHPRILHCHKPQNGKRQLAHQAGAIPFMNKRSNYISITMFLSYFEQLTLSSSKCDQSHLAWHPHHLLHQQS